jgi:hypothetical protein
VSGNGRIAGQRRRRKRGREVIGKRRPTLRPESSIARKETLLMKRFATTLTGVFILALAGTGGATAKAPVGSCPPKSAENPFELVSITDFPGLEFIDLNQNGSVCAFQLPFNPNAFNVIDDVAQVP